jgi:hypothetical protein
MDVGPDYSDSDSRVIAETTCQPNSPYNKSSNKSSTDWNKYVIILIFEVF